MQSIVDFVLDVTSLNTTGYVEIRELSTNTKQHYINRASLANVLPRFTSKIDTYFSIFTRKTKQGTSAAAGHTATFVVDIDLKDNTVSTDAYTQYTQLLTPTYVVFSGRGFHLYFCLNATVDPTTWQPLQKDMLAVFHHKYGDVVDTKITDVARVMRLPGTINSKSGRLCEIVYASGKKYTVAEIQQFILKHEDDTTVLKTLPTADITAICDLLSPYYREGHRHDIALHLAGTLYKSGVDINTALQIVQELAKRANDEEDRTPQVEYTYKKNVTEVATLSALVTQNVIPYSTYKAIKQILSRNTTYTHDNITNDVANAKILYNNKQIAYIAIQSLALVTIHDALVNTTRTVYRVEVVTRHMTETREYDIHELATILKDYAAHILPTRQAQTAIISLLNNIQVRYISEYEFSRPGVYIVDNNIYIHNIDTNADYAQVVKELQTFNDFVMQYWRGEEDYVGAVFAWGAVAPLWTAIKCVGGRLPYCYLYGASGTGKSTLALIISELWGTQAITGDHVRTIARMREVVSRSMFPQIVNEATPLFTDGNDAVALLLAAYDEVVVAQTLSRNATAKQFAATSALAFTSNTLPREQQVLRRLYTLFFKESQRKTASQEFMRALRKLSFTHTRKAILQQYKYLSIEDLQQDWTVLAQKILAPFSAIIPFATHIRPADATLDNTARNIVQEMCYMIASTVKRSAITYEPDLTSLQYIRVRGSKVYILPTILQAWRRFYKEQPTMHELADALRKYNAQFVTSSNSTSATLRDYLPYIILDKAKFFEAIAEYLPEHLPEL